jgi:predicted Zn finger-like uncharacterized protein
MVITCSKCNTNYNIEASKIPAAGVMATCKKCGNKFRVQCRPTPKPVSEIPIPVTVPVDAREKEMGLKPLAGLTTALRVLLMINIAVTILAVLTGIYEYRSYLDLPPGFDINETFLLSEAVGVMAGVIQTVAFIIVGITFLRWIYRTNTNLGKLSGQPMRFSPGWSVGWYFIPVACWFKPYQAMKEIWERSHKNQSDTGSILGLWWAFWLISTFLSDFAGDAIMEADSVREYTSSAMAYIVSDGFDVVLNIVALMLVSGIGNAYSKNYSQRRASTAGHPTPQGTIQPHRSKPSPSQTCTPI